MLDMKPVQITFDDALLKRLDRHPTVCKRGRSAVLREAAAEYLTRKDAEEIDRRYRGGYRADGAASDIPGIDEELDGWAAEGAWPES